MRFKAFRLLAGSASRFIRISTTRSLVRDSGTDIRVINAATGAQLSVQMPSATGTFTDFMLSPSGRYLFAADYGGIEYRV